MCWIRGHLFRQHKSGVLKFPGGGIATFDFLFKMFEGARGKPQLMVVNLGFLLFQLLVSAGSICRVIHLLKEGMTVSHGQL